MYLFCDYFIEYFYNNLEKETYERYIAKGIGKLSGMNINYDDVLLKIQNYRKGIKEKTGNEIVEDIITKFG